MSYGEPACRPDVGRAVELAAEVVNKAGVIFVASAGNAGLCVRYRGVGGSLLRWRSHLAAQSTHPWRRRRYATTPTTTPTGPALGTVGAPGGTSSALLGIGAYVSPALAAAGHSLRGGLAEGQQYTWSSRGPAPVSHDQSGWQQRVGRVRALAGMWSAALHQSTCSVPIPPWPLPLLAVSRMAPQEWRCQHQAVRLRQCRAGRCRSGS
jgi:hypothetical protein